MSERAPCVKCGRILHTGEGRVLVSFTADELEELARDTLDRDLFARLRCALSLLDEDRADALEYDTEEDKPREAKAPCETCIARIPCIAHATTNGCL